MHTSQHKKRSKVSPGGAGLPAGWRLELRFPPQRAREHVAYHYCYYYCYIGFTESYYNTNKFIEYM